MDGTKFDDLARRLAGRHSRRAVLRGLVGGGAALVATQATSLAAPPNRVTICHWDANLGAYVQLLLVPNAAAAHAAHHPLDNTNPDFTSNATCGDCNTACVSPETCGGGGVTGVCGGTPTTTEPPTTTTTSEEPTTTTTTPCPAGQEICQDPAGQASCCPTGQCSFNQGCCRQGAAPVNCGFVCCPTADRCTSLGACCPEGPPPCGVSCCPPELCLNGVGFCCPEEFPPCGDSSCCPPERCRSELHLLPSRTCLRYQLLPGRPDLFRRCLRHTDHDHGAGADDHNTAVREPRDLPAGEPSQLHGGNLCWWRIAGSARHRRQPSAASQRTCATP